VKIETLRHCGTLHGVIFVFVWNTTRGFRTPKPS